MNTPSQIRLPHNPAADLFPMMDGPEFDLLVADIRAHGLREPIVLDQDGYILDGRNRERACVLAGIPYETTTFEGDDPLAFVISRNLYRRHLNESQRAMVAMRLTNMDHGETRSGHGKIEGQICTSDAATLLNVSTRSVKTARAIRDRAAPSVVTAVDAGLVTIHDAAKVIDLPRVQQKALVAAVKAGKHKTLQRAAVALRREMRETPPRRPAARRRALPAAGQRRCRPRGSG